MSTAPIHWQRASAAERVITRRRSGKENKWASQLRPVLPAVVRKINYRLDYEMFLFEATNSG